MSVGCRRILAISLLIYFFIAAPPSFGQEQPDTRGKWKKSDGQDPADDRKVVMFTLPADEAELGRSPYIQLECTGDGKLVHARYFADAELTAKDADNRNYGAPAIALKLRVDKKDVRVLWDLLPGHRSAEMDKKALRALFTGKSMQVRYVDRAYNNFIDFYSVEGLNRDEVAKACGEQKWLAANAK